MRDHAKEVTIKRTEDGLAAVPYWQHEYELWKQRRTQHRLIGATALTGALAIISNLVWARALRKN